MPGRRDIWYMGTGVVGAIGMLGLPPFNILAWYLADRDMKAPGFHQMPRTYQQRVRMARGMGIFGTVLMVVFGVLMAVMMTINAVSDV